MFLQPVSKRLSGFNKYLFYHKDGFYELPYLSNSPEAIIKSIVKMPFVKHSEERRVFESDTPFLKATVHYSELEKGLWMICANAKYKANVNYRRVTEKDIPADYYMLSLEVSADRSKAMPVLINGMTYSKCTWLLFKPEVSVVRSHFKDSNTLSFAVFFNEEWLKKVLFKETHFINSGLKHFFESKAKYLIWPDTSESVDAVYKSIQDTLDGKGGCHSPGLKKQMNDLFSRFIDIYNAGETNQKFFDIPDNDREKIIKAERILVRNLLASFMGIEELSKQSAISPTRLKSCFKMMYGQSIFQYFRQKQMEHAYTLIKSKSLTVKEIANLFGYENAGKFSAAFLKQTGSLPSEIR
jgi:AraC-like DNA-binding protein